MEAPEECNRNANRQFKAVIAAAALHVHNRSLRSTNSRYRTRLSLSLSLYICIYMYISPLWEPGFPPTGVPRGVEGPWASGEAGEWSPPLPRVRGTLDERSP